MSKVLSHIDEKIQLHPYSYDHSGNLVKASHNAVVSSQTNEWNQWRRLVSKSPINTVLSQGSEIQFELNNTGHIQTYYFEIKITETGNASNSTINPYNLFQQIEIETNNAGTKFKTFYAEELYVSKMLHRSLTEHNRKRGAEGLGANFLPVANNVTQNTETTFYLEFDIFENSQPDLRLLQYPLLIRCYMNQPSYFVTAGSTALSLTGFSLIHRALDLPLYRYNIPIHHRYINYVRYQEQRVLAVNTEYDFKLTTFNKLSAYLFFVLRSTPTNSNPTNWSTYNTNIDYFQLNDAQNQIIGIQHKPAFNRFIVSQHFDCDFLNQVNGVYVIPFSLDPDASKNGQQQGSFRFSTNEILRIKTSATITPGNFELTVFSANHDSFSIDPQGWFHFTN